MTGEIRWNMLCLVNKYWSKKKRKNNAQPTSVVPMCLYPIFSKWKKNWSSSTSLNVSLSDFRGGLKIKNENKKTNKWLILKVQQTQKKAGSTVTLNTHFLIWTHSWFGSVFFYSGRTTWLRRQLLIIIRNRGINVSINEAKDALNSPTLIWPRKFLIVHMAFLKWKLASTWLVWRVHVPSQTQCKLLLTSIQVRTRSTKYDWRRLMTTPASYCSCSVRQTSVPSQILVWPTRIYIHPAVNTL